MVFSETKILFRKSCGSLLKKALQKFELAKLYIIAELQWPEGLPSRAPYS